MRHTWEEERCMQGFGEEPRKKGPLGRSRHILEDNIKMDQHVEWRDMDWTDVAQDRNRWLASVNAVMKFCVP
jgi:hypothetical protein